MDFFGHLRTINHHKILVTKMCFKVGLYWQGICHDLSKYNPIEFIPGVIYYQGDRSPINREKELKTCSRGWLHHKGRNPHHFEYWIDYSINPRGLVGMKMPKKYVAEMVVDRISASRNYLGDAYTDQEPLKYYLKSKEKLWFIHPETKRDLEAMLRILADHGEKKTLDYIRRVYLKRR